MDFAACPHYRRKTSYHLGARSFYVSLYLIKVAINLQKTNPTV
nr:MAG TPA: hypothetical protein [Caudoviricetes sp.]